MQKPGSGSSHGRETTQARPSSSTFTAAQSTQRLLVSVFGWPAHHGISQLKENGTGDSGTRSSKEAVSAWALTDCVHVLPRGQRNRRRPFTLVSLSSPESARDSCLRSRKVHEFFVRTRSLLHCETYPAIRSPGSSHTGRAAHGSLGLLSVDTRQKNIVGSVATGSARKCSPGQRRPTCPAAAERTHSPPYTANLAANPERPAYFRAAPAPRYTTARRLVSRRKLK